MDQQQILQNLSGEKRLEQALLLSDFVRELAIKNIRTQLGRKASKKKIMEKLKERLSLMKA